MSTKNKHRYLFCPHRPKTTSEVSQKCRKKTCTLSSPRPAPTVRVRSSESVQPNYVNLTVCVCGSCVCAGEDAAAGPRAEGERRRGPGPAPLGPCTAARGALKLSRARLRWDWGLQIAAGARPRRWRGLNNSTGPGSRRRWGRPGACPDMVSIRLQK